MPPPGNFPVLRNQPPPPARPINAAARPARFHDRGSVGSHGPGPVESYIKMVSADALRWSLVSTRAGVWTIVSAGRFDFSSPVTNRLRFAARRLSVPLVFLALAWIAGRARKKTKESPSPASNLTPKSSRLRANNYSP